MSMISDERRPGTGISFGGFHALVPAIISFGRTGKKKHEGLKAGSQTGEGPERTNPVPVPEKLSAQDAVTRLELLERGHR